jgi:hypothetical protein
MTLPAFTSDKIIGATSGLPPEIYYQRGRVYRRVARELPPANDFPCGTRVRRRLYTNQRPTARMATWRSTGTKRAAKITRSPSMACAASATKKPAAANAVGSRESAIFGSR